MITEAAKGVRVTGIGVAAVFSCPQLASKVTIKQQEARMNFRMIAQKKMLALIWVGIFSYL